MADEQQILRKNKWSSIQMSSDIWNILVELSSGEKSKTQSHQQESPQIYSKKQQHVALIRSFFLNGESTTMPFYIVHCKPSFLYVQEEC